MEGVPDEQPSRFLRLQRALLAVLAANRPPALVSLTLPQCHRAATGQPLRRQ
ncbi:hypothetical protein B0H17DRAFT_1182437 [Mycena rosella]|uniref:Uncharacterized protein n=1 Tax=Mycena rosella TaxID=1033263 RepID=A0AAD7D4B4_MYCRO|nr:hypothetical protein B0H17DRAFT_1182437 [Mycena rosella]